MNYYRAFRRNINDKGILITTAENLYARVKDDAAYYASIYEYNEEQHKQFLKLNSVSGISDVTTPRLIWDFDSKDDIEQSRKDCLTLVSRLKSEGIETKDILIAWSGNKGFHVEILTTSRFTVQEFKNITKEFARDLPTRDEVVSDANRVIRLLGSKHEKSGLLKVRLKPREISDYSIEEIKELSKQAQPKEDFNINPVSLSEAVLAFTKPAEDKKELIKPTNTDDVEKVLESLKVDFTKKPRGWTNCKWALANGYTLESEKRHNKLVSLAATVKAQNYTKSQAYYFIKDAMEKGAEFYGCEKSTKEDLWDNIIEGSVYKDTWKGGQYSCKDGKTDWLSDLCNSLGKHRCHQISETTTIETDEVFSLFKNYAKDYKNNALRTGIEELDEKANFMVGTSNAIVASPGVGKTSLALSILNYNSKQGIPCIFYSYDMFHSAVYMRMLQKHFNKGQREIYRIFNEDPDKMREMNEELKSNYENVRFCFKSGQTISELEETILETNDRTGKPTKLVLVDYNELVQSDYSDATAASAQVAQAMRQIANDREVCIITLLQPSKNFSSPSDEVTDFKAAKGSSAIVQAQTLMLGLSRPGFNPLKAGTPHNTDRFFNITCLKNRNGPLFTLDFGWDGLTGELQPLEDDARAELAGIRSERAASKEIFGK